MRIGIYGGTFDPVHFGHLLLAESARQQVKLDKVIFVPAGHPPHKHGWKLAEAEHRARMIELAINGNPFFCMDRFELNSAKISYTIHTVEYFESLYPGAELFLLLGEDMLRDFPHWYHPERICEKATPLVIGRAGCEVEDLEFLQHLASAERMKEIEKCRVHMIPVAYASSVIREMIAAGESVLYQTPFSVLQYIKEHQLYCD
ncbi:MAG: nicotinate (nicotinamide) nucleotide adenylyltransferase [Planctomycetia bacterium]|nr:nicotinate (nicotinamide) nucleotide adenylyltransferase [Planctomycetia bacterium]